MKVEGLLLAVLDTSEAVGDPTLSGKYRDLTICWSRYGYHDEIIEGPGVDGLLEEAMTGGYRYCLIQPYGHIIHERWTPEGRDFFDELSVCIRQQDFLAMGRLIGDADAWYGFHLGCLVVDLDMYRQLGTPQFDVAVAHPVEVPAAIPRHAHGAIAALLPGRDNEVRAPRLPGWQFISASLRAGMPVLGLSDGLASRSLDLEATCSSRQCAFAGYLDRNIANFPGRERHDQLSADQTTFLSVISAQTAHARRGVFLWNIESYADIERPKSDFRGPVSSLYSVAAGFKPNRILRTHGLDEATRVVYFDYSPNALEVKKCLVQQWDGEDFPHFVKYLFKRFPHPDTFYQLWQERTPENVAWSEIEDIWTRELARWGGAPAFREHWRAYRKLRHEYVCCDLLADASPLLETITDGEREILWWSNAFFTMYGNWFYSLDQRQRIYQQWIERIAAKNPALYLFGSDDTNANVNCLQAGEYWQQYRDREPSCLRPCKLYDTEIRM